jgi:hypothetical protein
MKKLLTGLAVILLLATFTYSATRINNYFEKMGDTHNNLQVTGTLSCGVLITTNSVTFSTNTSVGGALNVTGEGTFASTVDITGTLTTTSNTVVGGGCIVTGQINGATLDTGQGHNELYAMDQNVRTTDDITIHDITYTGSLICEREAQTVSISDTIVSSGTIVVLTSSGAAITMTSNPQIANGSTGQILILEGTHDTNTVTLADGNGLNLTGAITLGAEDILTVMYNGTDWIQVSNADN